MKIIACFAIITFIITGCTTLRPAELSQPAIQQRISAGELIQPGDKVRITTTDGKQYKFKVTSVDGEYIKGKEIEIPLKDITLVEKRKFSMGKTTLLVGGIVYALYEISLILAAPAFIMGGG